MIEQALKAGIPQCVVFVADNCKRKKKYYKLCIALLIVQNKRINRYSFPMYFSNDPRCEM